MIIGIQENILRKKMWEQIKQAKLKSTPQQQPIQQNSGLQSTLEQGFSSMRKVRNPCDINQDSDDCLEEYCQDEKNKEDLKCKDYEERKRSFDQGGGLKFSNLLLFRI